jgi:hypothetical protein
VSKIFFISDMFSDECNGGAELTTESIILDSPYEIEKIKSRDLTEEFCSSNKDKFWIFGNFSFLLDSVKKYALQSLKYSVIEYDYKYCKFRSEDLHILNAGRCDCGNELGGKLNLLFLNNAKATWWMSKNQKSFYFEKFPFLEKRNNIVLSSVFSTDTIEYISSVDKTNKNNKWIILNSPSWIKNREGCVAYAKKNNLDYELVWGIEYKDLLTKLGKSKGLVFLPLGKDTCPRITIESKLLCCEMVLNENVQHRDESWFESEESILEYLPTRTALFWEEISRHV